ncbi:MAG: gliding motility-associated C-terminal domain-containing protein, partial [Bacteroidales bacterium]
MNGKTLYIFLLMLCLATGVQAATDDELPSAEPTMTVTNNKGETSEETSFNGDAPMTATFRANPKDLGAYTPRYEWRFVRAGESAPFLTRYEETTTYTFAESGTFTVTLLVSFVNGDDVIEYDQSDGGEPFNITISESLLEFPNAFTPNGDGINDVFKAKEGYRSIVSFKAIVFNRNGKKLYEWTDPA